MFVVCDGYSRDYQTSPIRVPLPEYCNTNEPDNEIMDTEAFEVL